MIRCRTCGYLCDTADIRGGECDDCRRDRAEEEQRQIRAKSVQRMMGSPSTPIKMDVLAKTVLGIGGGR